MGGKKGAVLEKTPKTTQKTQNLVSPHNLKTIVEAIVEVQSSFYDSF
jgi:hypothetical protein